MNAAPGAPGSRPTADALFDAARGGDRRSLGRLLSMVEAGGAEAEEVAATVWPHTGRAHVIGITGPPGAGKSTLTARLIEVVAATAAEPGAAPGAAPREGPRVGVVAVDPSSPVTGGAILGDRIRMDHRRDDEARGGRVFIRSMATRGQGGGLSLAVPGAARVLDAAGFDPVILETVGVGQVEVAVAAVADTTVVVVNPGWGDAVQVAKAGLLEVGDVFVVNKADRPGADDAVRDLEHMLDLAPPGTPRPAVLRTVATTGEGIPALHEALVARFGAMASSGELARRRAAAVRHEVRARVLAELSVRVDAVLAGEAELLGALAAGRVSPGEAAARVLARWTGGGDGPVVPPRP